jgi:hypothetical protein
LDPAAPGWLNLHRQDHLPQILIAGGTSDHDFTFARLRGIFHVHIAKGKRLRGDLALAGIRLDFL